MEIAFGVLGIVSTHRNIGVITQGPPWNYTSVLNIVFLANAAALVIRFLRTGGPAMLAMMDTPEDEMDRHDHSAHAHAQSHTSVSRSSASHVSHMVT